MAINYFHFDGRLAKAPPLSGSGDRAICKFTLIQNAYAGKDDATGEKREKVVAISFTAFRGKAEAIAKHCHKGDQLIVTARIDNNNWTDDDGGEHYDYNFVVDEFSFGAPGEEKRALLESRQPA
jgi:single-strand DNA-binding protein